MAMPAEAGPRPRLLILDDEARILSALRRALRREGYDIVTFETAEDALLELRERPVDAILTDQKMPGMSGLEFLRRSVECCPDAVRMLITGWTETLPQDQIESLRVRALITKPWDDARLKTTLRKLLVDGP
jgi:response regulator RpfG family c-di-GMP phosphodiesterase